MLSPNTILQGRYQVAGVIGQGGMGALYEASDQRLRTRVALKQLLHGGPQLSRAFEREAQILAQLRHPALPRVLDHFDDPAGQFLVMEYVEGVDLEELMRQRARPFPIDQVLEWGDQLLEILAYLHRQQPPVLHRDVKPKNLKLSPGGQLVLLDFGLAKSTSAHQTMSSHQSITGYTPHYAPLEQIQGGVADARGDLYAVGATLYYLLTGHTPEDALTRASSIINGRPDPLMPARTMRPDIPRGLSALLHKTLALPADARPRSAVELQSELRDLRRGLSPALATPLGAPPAVLHSPAEPAQPAATGQTLLVEPARPHVDSAHTKERPRWGTRIIYAILVILLALIAYTMLGLLRDDAPGRAQGTGHRAQEMTRA